MPSKLRIVQSDREEIVVKAATEQLIAEARKVIGSANGVLVVEKKGRTYHLAGKHIVRLETEAEDDQDEE